jgi:MFS family permease
MSTAAPVEQGRETAKSAPIAIALASSVVVVSGVNLIYPILPVVSSDLDIDESRIGLVIAAFTLPAVFLAPLFGLFADFYGRRWLLVFGLLMFAVFGAAAALAPNLEWLLVWRALQGVGMSALSPLTIVLISDLYTQREQELQAQGWKVAIDRIAMILLPLVGGALAIYSWRLAFLVFALVIPIALVALALMPETRPQGARNLSAYFHSMSQAIRERKVSLAFAVGFLRFFLDYGIFIYLPLLLTLRYGASVIVSGIMLALSAVGAIVTATTVRYLSGFASLERLLVFAYLVTVLGLAVILARPPLWVIGVGAFAIGLGNGLISPLQKSMITRNAPPTLRGGVISCDRVVQQVAKTLAPSLLGLLLVVAPIESVFLVLLGIGLIGAAMMLIADSASPQ